MKNILLVCAAGMSTSMLVKRMQEHLCGSGDSSKYSSKYQCAAISETKEKNQKKTKWMWFY